MRLLLLMRQFTIALTIRYAKERQDAMKKTGGSNGMKNAAESIRKRRQEESATSLMISLLTWISGSLMKISMTNVIVSSLRSALSTCQKYLLFLSFLQVVEKSALTLVKISRH